MHSIKLIEVNHAPDIYYSFRLMPKSPLISPEKGALCLSLPFFDPPSLPTYTSKRPSTSICHPTRVPIRLKQDPHKERHTITPSISPSSMLLCALDRRRQTEWRGGQLLEYTPQSQEQSQHPLPALPPLTISHRSTFTLLYQQIHSSPTSCT